MNLVSELLDELSELVRRASLQPDSTWTDKAATWPTVTIARQIDPDHMYLTHEHPDRESITAIHICCAECPDQPSVFCLSPDGESESYRVTSADIQSGILAHIRRSHDS